MEVDVAQETSSEEHAGTESKQPVLYRKQTGGVQRSRRHSACRRPT